MIDELLSDLKSGYEQAVVALRRESSKIRTGRANPNILEGLRVDYYGTPTPVMQIAAVKVADARMITIQPWEKNMINAIEKAILTSDLGLNPSNDGTLIRLPVPALTGDRRRELSKQVKDMVAYRSFLEKIGYLVPQPAEVKATADEVTICSCTEGAVGEYLYSLIRKASE